MEIKWIKLSTDIFDNRKIKQIEAMPDGDALIVIWLKILTLAGTVNDNGCVYFTKDIPYTDQLLATQFGRPLATIQLALRVFQQFGMIEIVGNMIYVSNWEKYQNVDGLERVREQTRERVARHRERQKALEDKSNVTVTLRNATERDIEEDKEIDKVKKKVLKKKYGVGENVLLTEEEYEKLQEKFPYDYEEKIENLSLYLGSTGKRYKSHYMTILSWANKDDKKPLIQKKKEGRLDFLDDI